MNNYENLLATRGLDIFSVYTLTDPTDECVRWVYLESDDSYVGQIDTNTWEWVD